MEGPVEGTGVETPFTQGTHSPLSTVLKSSPERNRWGGETQRGRCTQSPRRIRDVLTVGGRSTVKGHTSIKGRTVKGTQGYLKGRESTGPRRGRTRLVE